MSTQSRVVAGSERTPLPGAQVVGNPDPQERIAVTVRLRSRSREGLASLADMYTRLPEEQRHLTREEYATQHGADPTDITAIERFAHEHDLDVVEVSAPRRMVRLSGTIEQMQAAFGVELKRYEYPGGSYRGREGAISVPEEIHDIVEGVFGLDDRPVARPHFRPRSPEIPDPAFTPPQLASLYNFPAGATGQGQCIGILELGGGYRTKDLKAYFTGLGLAMPNIVAISVDGGHNQPTNANSADGEVMLDIEVAGSVAPGASLAVYFAPNQGAGFLDALTAAIHDDVHKPTVISISWGGPEDLETDQDRQAFDQALQAAAALGVTVCVAAGDDGSSDLRPGTPNPDNLPAHVDFPASSPFALACGGTRLAASGNAIGSEVVWDELAAGSGATGGGISDKFAVPSYQAGLAMPTSANPGAGPGRGVPDVAGDADPMTGYHVIVDGQSMVIGGTSAVAPLWAGLIACINQRLGHNVGFLNPLLYSNLGPDGALNDISLGNNGGYMAGNGWDACTGWGSPNGTKILLGLTATTGHAVVTMVAPSTGQLLTPTEK